MRNQGVSYTFYKYLLSYLVIFLLPLTIIVAVTHSSLVKEYEAEFFRNNADSFSKVKYSFELIQKSISNICIQVSCMPVEDFSKNLIDYPKNAREIQQRFQSYQHVNDYITELAYYPKNSGVMYGSKSSYNMFFYRYRFEDLNNIYTYMGYESFVSFLDTIEEPVWLSGGSIPSIAPGFNKVITYIYPLRSFDSIPNAALIIQLDESILTRMLKSSVPDYKGDMIIAAKSGDILSSTLSDPDTTEAVINNIMKDNKLQNAFVASVNNRDTFISYSMDADKGWYIVNFIPAEYVFEKVRKIMMVFYSALFLATLAGFLFVYLFMRLNYNPVRMLLDYVNKSSEGQQKNMSEFDNAKYAVNRLWEDKKQLNDTVNMQGKVLGRLLIERLLRGEFSSIESFNYEGSKFGLAFSGKYFQVAAVQTEESYKFKDGTEGLCEILGSYFGGTIKASCVYCQKRTAFVVLLSYGENDRAGLKFQFEAFKRYVDGITGTAVTIGIGSRYNETRNIYMSYIEAFTAIDFKNVKEDSGIIYFNEVMDTKTNYYSHPTEQLEKLKAAVKKQDVRTFDVIVDELLGRFTVSHTNVVLARFLCHDIISAVLQGIDEKGSGFIQTENLPDLITITEISSLAETIEAVRSFCSSVKSCLNDTGHTKLNTIVEICEYINSSYLEQSFTIQGVADKFGISISNLSQQFKRYTGQTISDYVNGLRIERAQGLLRSTQLSLKDVSEAVRYADISNFTRRFKMVTGKTPGQYRKIWAE